MSKHGTRHGRVILLLLVMATAALAVSAQAASSPSAGSVLLENRLDSGAWTWETAEDGGRYLAAEGFRTLNEPGLPRLPFQDLLLLIPADREVAEAWIEPLSVRREKGAPVPAAALPHVTDSGEIHDVSRLRPADGSFPASWGEFAGVHSWRGYRLLGMNLYPVRSISSADDHSLEFLEAYAVRVRYADGSSTRHTLQRERFVAGEKESNENILRSLVANPSAVSGYARPAGVMVAEDGPFNPSRTPSLTGSAVQYVIVTTEAMKDEFQVLADFKTRLGMPTVVATREFIAANYRHGADIQETIRMFLQDAYAKWGTEYVLLGGDTEVLPARYVSNSFYPASGHTDIPVDLYFACLDGNWNANGNAHFAETETLALPDDEADFAEEVFLGRATVTTAAEAAVFVSKVMQYQSAPNAADWPNRILYAAEVLFPAEYIPGSPITLDGAQFSDQMVEELVEPCTDMEYMRMYETDTLYPRDANLSRTALIDSLNTGRYGILNQIGHGYYFNMSVGDANFMNVDADNLTNDNYFALFSLNCASAAFDFSCLMERFLQNPDGGSIISVGSARAAFPNSSNNYQQGFFQALMCTGETHAGKLIAISRLPYLANTAYNYVDRWTFENYTLLGDPSLPIWSGSPRGLNVSATPLTTGPNEVFITVRDAASQPVAGATVCLSRAGEDHVVGQTDAQGHVYLDYLVSRPGTVSLTVSGKNLALRDVLLNVYAGQTYFDHASNTYQDDGSGGTAGNGNMTVEAGETVAILPNLEETLGQGAAGLSGTLSTTSAGVSISNPTVAFEDVEAYGTTQPQNPFLISFDAALPDGMPVDFRLDLTDESARSYAVEWVQMVLAPEPEVVLVDWQDVAHGNGDGILDSGERVVVSVRLKNFGAGILDDMDLRLRSLDGNVVLHDTVGSVSDLELLETSGDIATFSLALVDPGLKSESFLHMTDNHGRISTHNFYLQRPEAPGEITTDTSLGADIIALRWEPVADEDILGYNVYRSLSSEGPFDRVNADIIAGTSYFRDEGLAELTKYYYQVEAVASPLVPSQRSVTMGQSTAPAEMPGFPVSFNNETSSHLAVGDVDGDGDLETVLSSDEVYVWHHDGTELLDGDGDSQTLGVFTDLGMTLSPAGIALAQLDGEPGWEIILSVLDPVPSIYVFKGDGSILEGWPKSLQYGAGPKWNWATPGVGDVDGDNDLEIVVNTLNGKTFAFHHDGTEVLDGDDDPSTDGIFLVRDGATYEWGISSPTLADLNEDGACEIIFGTASDNEGGARVEVRQADGTSLPGFPYFVNGRINSSVAAADLDGNGHLELVISSLAPKLYAIRADGSAYPGFPVSFSEGTQGGSIPSVALGDMDEDGQLEIIYARNVSGIDSRLVVVDTDHEGGTSGSLLNGWPIALPGSSEGSPVVGDLNGDSVPDILFGIGGGNEEAPNNLYAFEADGTPLDGFPITLGGPLMPSPVITDIDRDQDVDIVMGGWDRLCHVWDMPFAFNQASNPWPTFAGNMQRDGVYLPGYLVGVEDEQDLPSADFVVGAPYPNPFNPSTSVRLHVPTTDTTAQLELVVYDLQGRKVRTLYSGPISSGWHTMVWDGRDDGGRGQSSGLYFMRARSGSVSSIHKMTLIK